MASGSYLPAQVHPRTNLITFHLSPLVLSFRSGHRVLLHPRLRADGASIGSREADWLRKTVVSQVKDVGRILEDKDSEENGEYDEDDGEDERWLDWEDQILEDTVPLVGFVRTILHSGKYESGDRLSPEHEKTILEKLLPFHPEVEKKIGSGVDYITIGYHPNFESSRCFFIVRKDGEMIDFSYWKCIKGLIRKNYPLYADSFILRHFRKRRRNL